MLDRVTGLQVFARVAALGNLSAAARALGMSQTMATKHVAALEDRLGTKLLHRTTRRISLTEAGRAYLESIERILADLDEADALAAAVTVEVRGTLRLNVPVSFGMREIAPLLPELARRHPKLTIDLGLNDRQVDLIEEGWDLAVRIGAMRDSGLIARRLAPCTMLVCAAPRYLAEHGTPHTIAELGQHVCLGYTLSQSVGAHHWSFGADGGRRVAIQGSSISRHFSYGARLRPASWCP
jgi:DNA-binding transcriptional LysR family regulator